MLAWMAWTSVSSLSFAKEETYSSSAWGVGAGSPLTYMVFLTPAAWP